MRQIGRYVALLCCGFVLARISDVGCGESEQKLRPAVHGTFHGPAAPFHNSRQSESSVTVFEAKYVRVQQHRIVTEAGRLIDDWLWVDVADHVNVVAEAPSDALPTLVAAADKGAAPWVGAPPQVIVSDRVRLRAKLPADAVVRSNADDPALLLFQQLKYGFEGLSIAALGGLSEPGEPPLATAMRELAEEIGIHCSTWHQFGGNESYRVDANRGCGRCAPFLAADCRVAERRKGNTAPPAVDGGDLEKQALVVCTVRDLLDSLRGRVTGGCGTAPIRELKWAHTFSRVVLHYHFRHVDS